MAASRAQIDNRRVAVALALLAALTASAVTISLFLWPVGDARDDDPLRPRSLFAASDLAPGEVRTFAFTEDGITELVEGRIGDALFRVHVVRLNDGELRAFDARSTHLGCPTVWRELSVPGFDQDFFFNDVCSGATFTIEGRAVFGPAPRALDRVHLELRGGLVVVDPSRITRGEERPRGSRSTPTPVPTAVHEAADEDPSAGY